MKLTTPPSARRADARDRDLRGGAGRTSSPRSASPRSAIDVTPLGFRLDARRRAATPEADAARPLELGDAPVVLSRRAEARAQEPRRPGPRASRSLADRGVMLVLPGLADAARGRAAGARRASSASRTACASRVDARTPSSRASTRWRDVFVLPSFEEGFGLPILEAMGRGVPVACSNVVVAARGGRATPRSCSTRASVGVDRAGARAAARATPRAAPSWSARPRAAAASSRGSAPPGPRSRATGGRSRPAPMTRP